MRKNEGYSSQTICYITPQARHYDSMQPNLHDKAGTIERGLIQAKPYAKLTPIPTHIVQCGSSDTMNNMIHKQHSGQRIRPFSLHSKHLFMSSSSSSNTFLLPLQFGQGKNLTSPQASQMRFLSLMGNT